MNNEADFEYIIIPSPAVEDGNAEARSERQYRRMNFELRGFHALQSGPGY